MTVGRGPGQDPNSPHSQGESGTSRHQQHHTQRRDQELARRPQGLPPRRQLVKQADEEPRVTAAEQQGGANVLGDQRPAPDAPWLQG